MSEALTGPRVRADRLLGQIASTVLLVTLALGLVVPKLAGAGFLMLALLSLIWLESAYRHRRIGLQSVERTLYFVIAAFVLVWLASWWLHGLDPVGSESVGRILRLLMIIPLVLFLSRIEDLQRSWWLGLALGAMASGLYALWFTITGETGDWDGRVGGPTNPIYFGGIVLAFGLMLLPRITDEHLPAVHRMMAAAGVIMAILASALSGSRGAWIAFPLLLLLYVVRPVHQQRAWLRLVLPVSIVFVAIAISLLPIAQLGERFGTGWEGLMALLNGQKPGGTLGIRIDLWQVAVQAIRDAFLFGGGPGYFRSALEQAVAAGQVDPYLLRYHHPHNQFLSALLIGGIPGLISLVLMLGCPLLLFTRAWLGASASQRAMAWCGLTSLIVLFVMMLSESIFQRNNGIVWFVVLLAVNAALVLSQRATAQPGDG